MAELFAFGPVEAFEECGDEVFLELEFFLKYRDFLKQHFVLLDELGCLFVDHMKTVLISS